MADLGNKIRTIVEKELGTDIPELEFTQKAVDALAGELEGYNMRLQELLEEQAEAGE